MKNSGGLANFIGSTLFGFLLLVVIGFGLPRLIRDQSVLRTVLWIIFAVVVAVLCILFGMAWLKKRP